MKLFMDRPLAGSDVPYRWSTILLLFILFIAPLTAPGQTEARNATHVSPAPSRSHVAVATADRSVVVRIVTSPALPNVIVLNLGSLDGPLRYSRDSGYTWHSLTPPQPLPGIAIAPRPDGSVRILGAGGVNDLTAIYRTGDFGASWSEQVIIGLFADTLIASPAEPARLYMSGNVVEMGCFPFICAQYYSDVYMSNDAGVSWASILSSEAEEYAQIVSSPVVSTTAYVYEKRLANWVELPYGRHLEFPVDTLALDAVDPARMYGAVFDVTSPATISAGKTSSNGGDIWSLWPTTPSGCIQLMAHPTKSGFLYLRCGQGLYRSVDAGQHWKQISPMKGDLLAPNYGIPGQLLWAREDGFWASNDDGSSWFQLSDGMYNQRMYLPCVMQGARLPQLGLMPDYNLTGTPSIDGG
jgi:hypothetical protein